MTVQVYERPESLEEATRLLVEQEGAHALSGGTDLAVAMRHGKAETRVVVDLKWIPELASSVTRLDGGFRIAANTVMRDLEQNEDVRREFPGLVEAAEVVGSVQIRNRATLAGNLCNASPAADTPPVLIALGASLELQGTGGARSLSIDDFFMGYRQTSLQPGELITAITVPGRASSSSAFLKLGVRRAMEISIVCVGAMVELDETGRISAAGIGLGSVAPTTVRATTSEAMLIGSEPSPDLFAEAGRLAASDCTPIDDLRASGEYRHAMVPVLVRRALATAWQRARPS
jgi:carbon-monoxide dehydrogenase medium subunit